MSDAAVVKQRSGAVPLRAARHGDNDLRSLVFAVLLWCSLAFGVIVLAVLLVDTFLDALPRLDTNLLTRYTSQVMPERAGARAAILGSAWVVGTTALLAVPIGVAAAAYLEEFAARTSRFAHLVEVNVQNLAAVPAIIYGMLTAGFVVTVGIKRNSVLSGAIALALLILPVIIVTTREALRAVPREIRQASLALGATPMQTLWRQTLPAAIPGIATGTILALSRALGEAAPLLLLGGLVFVTYDPDGLLSGFSTLPIQIFDWSSRSQQAFQDVASAAIIVLLVLLLAMNAVAIYIRNHFHTAR
jgi:phosphate ABC transporter permease subunit PstA